VVRLFSCEDKGLEFDPHHIQPIVIHRMILLVESLFQNY